MALPRNPVYPVDPTSPVAPAAPATPGGPGSPAVAVSHQHTTVLQLLLQQYACTPRHT